MVKSNIQPNYKASKYPNQSNIDQNITGSAYSSAMFKMMDFTQWKPCFIKYKGNQLNYSYLRMEFTQFNLKPSQRLDCIRNGGKKYVYT